MYMKHTKKTYMYIYVKKSYGVERQVSSSDLYVSKSLTAIYNSLSSALDLGTPPGCQVKNTQTINDAAKPLHFPAPKRGVYQYLDDVYRLIDWMGVSAYR